MLTVMLSEIPSLRGRSFTGEPFVVSRSERDAFDEVTWVNRAYPDPDAPEFPENILEGFHTLSLLDSVAGFMLRFDPATTYGFNYGLDRVRFTAPLPIDTPVVPEFTVVEVKPRGDGFLILRHFRFTVMGSPDPALVADWWNLVLPRSDASDAVINSKGGR